MFQRVDCSEEDIADLCIDVLFADGTNDMLLVSPRSEDAPTVMKGALKSNKETKVVVILSDEFNPRTTVSVHMKLTHYKLTLVYTLGMG